ncbi:type II toxin-antitoxin system prevent-host-death family antitoxin [Candidatus Peribacteria bacterium]|nr:type II toxin-antitoxin system prevent-host-death family antitoxin [Candidatus Peribacteria bacterium]
MPTTVGIYYAKTHFSELMEKAALGEEFEVTKNGKIKGRIAPPHKTAKADTASVVQRMLAYRDSQNRTTGSMTIKEMIEEGRRF